MIGRGSDFRDHHIARKGGRLMSRIAVRGLAATVAGVSLLAVTVPVDAVTQPQNQGIVASGNGTAGVAQTVDVIAPKSPNTTLDIVATLGEASDVMTVSLDAKGEGSVTWVPDASGTWTIGAAGEGLSLRMSKSVIEAVPTTTDIYVPNKAERFKPMGLFALVTATEGAAEVSGTVTFYETYRGKIGEVTVNPGPGERALANLTWTPPGAGTYAFHSEFTPSTQTPTGTASTQASVSGTSYLNVVESAVPVQLLMPPVMRVGKPALVIAQLPDINRASVRLDIDGRPVSPSKSTENGIATFVWVPTHTGLTYVQLELEGTHHPLIARLVTQTIDVRPDRIPNPISVTPVINGVPGAPWADGEVLTYRAGTQVTLVTSSGNGAAVTFDQTGTCTVSGPTLGLPVAGGGCSITFSAPGDAEFASNQATVIVSSSVTPTASTGTAGKRR